jgi:peptidylprolyl isomerase/peptidyl-prolyl cis-trans isomerase B (cyclophilin B)
VPTEKRQRQKEGRQARLLAQRKLQRRRQLLRRSLIVVVIAAIVGYTAYKLEAGGHSSSGPTTHTRLVTQQEIAFATATNAALTKAIFPQERLAPSQRSAAQVRANAKAVAAGCPASTTTRVNTLTWPQAPKMTILTTGTYHAIVTTDLGSFTIALDAKNAPIVVNNFVFLAEHHYYNCVIFHRVIPQFMNQTGDPTGKGSGGPGYTIADEWPETASNPGYQYPPGGVAMAANSLPSGGTAPHTAGSQFFIVTGKTGEGLAPTYSLFGTVTKGLNVVAEINGQGSSAGVPPDVTHRILSITIMGPPK